MSFVNSSHTIITGENTLNHFQGNEVNSTINADTVYFNTSQAVTKRTECDQFREVIRGDMIKVKELHSEEFSEWDWEWRNGELVGRCKSSAQRTIYTVKIVDRQSKFTAMVYEGKDAQDFWEKDFQLFSHTHNPQLFGINQSAIPALIFHHELIPCAHFYTGSLWMNVYIQHLRQNMGCIDEMLWMNTTTGVLFCGPDGPSTQFPYLVANKSIVVPHTIDMLKDDTSFRFFSKFGRGVDYSVLECALLSSKPTFLDNLSPQMAEDHQSKDADHPDWSPAMPQCLRSLWRNPPAHIPMDIIGGLRFDTIYSPSLEAVARRPQDACLLWKWWDIDGLVDRTELDGGLVRFKLDLAQRKGVCLGAAYHWLRSQGKENFFAVRMPELTLQSTQRPRTFPTHHNARHPIEDSPLKPIYLFVHPLPMTLSGLISWMEEPSYSWSLDKTGQSQLSEEECEQWDLPVLVLDTEYPSQVQLYSWPTHIYDALQDWQKARGFDPTTPDWACSMGYPEHEIIGAEDGFVHIEEVLAEDLDWEVLDP
ncbi:hypothetical protein Moror_5927 [Moniliophthora roreri MCA 2997]|uniref:Uncharacterized protein n=1 Tax=Moniliophthora roreri (strain MCA 2997) TaxID=1381753 RepID=V2WUW7_MONRO|nr:hypothetical protein Moror_5927 [Moniliophthora roreri MCA 2997]